VTEKYKFKKGSPHPLGAVKDEKGVNFSVFSLNATGIELLLFNKHDDPQPVQIINLDPKTNKTFHFWHAYVENLDAGMHYAYRVDGSKEINQGHRYNPNKVLIDPYAFGNTCNLFVQGDACGDIDNLNSSMRSVVIDLKDYDWEGDKPLNIPMNETIIYETHVGGFTKSKTAKVKNPGTFLAVIDKIPYLKKLGITAVEFLPVMQFDDNTILKDSPDGYPLVNYWGYSTISFFAPHPGFCVSPEEGTHINEFRDMVKALHKAGIEVILDIVFNHTDEGNHQGPTYNFKGFDNSVYYHLVNNDKQYYMDYTGCGNTVNCNHPITEKLIVECLEFWVREMHVDGFRFDEASILSRGMDGNPVEYPPVLWNIELSEILADTKIIAEAWDAAGLYQIGYFPGYRWAEWNGLFRDDIRKFIKGEAGIIGAVANRIGGSADLYESTRHEPINSINFLTAHDGFTLNDLVSYNEKHNWANGENNNDGINENISWNCGVEGETIDEGIERLRIKQIKNFATILLFSQGVPMIVAGDEIRRSQKGNNNTYCHDNELNWFDWESPKKNEEVFDFFCNMNKFRRKHSVIHRARFFDGSKNERELPDISWHGCKLFAPDWNDPNARCLAFTLAGFNHEDDIHVMMNMFWEGLEFETPKVMGRNWYRVIDTSLSTGKDFMPEGKEIKIQEDSYIVSPRTIVALISKV